MRRMTLALASMASVLVVLLHLVVGTKAALFTLTIALALSSGALIPTGEALGLRAAQTYGFSYAYPRAVGSLAFLLMVLGMGIIIDRYGVAPVPLIIALSLVATGLFGLYHPGGGAAPGELDQASSADAWRLLSNPIFWVFAGGFSLGQASHAVFYTYSSIQWRDSGFSGELIGGLWSIGVAAEIALMFGCGRWLVNRLGPANALGLAALAGIVRWSFMLTDPPVWLLWPLQTLHALTFGLSLLAGMAFVAEAVPRRLAATAQGMTAGLLGGATMAAITLFASFAAPIWAPSDLYWLAIAPATISFVLCYVLSKIWQGGALKM